MKIDRLYLARFMMACAIVLGALALSAAMPVAADEDELKPEAPANLRALTLNVQEVVLSWSAVSAEASLTRYTVHRNGERIAAVHGNALNYVDTTVQASATYTYTVRALDAEGEASASSPPAVVTVPALPDTPDITPPSPPQTLTATPIAGAVALDWYDANDDSDITAYVIRRDGRVLATVGPGTLSYTDADVQPSTTYIYTVEAIDVMGHHSPLSNAVSVVWP
jgi:chitin-binding protein